MQNDTRTGWRAGQAFAEQCLHNWEKSEMFYEGETVEGEICRKCGRTRNEGKIKK